ncbi:unnamed protein product [Chrysodeixis includens]|uniref:Epoxide hydrolase n=1 Tax=Chrysodeixis includens TaxID=689277 RepID=A0A9P0BZK0_CHRIL|nr:unnamed protein product [Chrysodeixis includens]
MDKILRLLILCASILAVRCAISATPIQIPNFDDWWGPEDAQENQDTSIRPFKIEFTKCMIKDLRYRLRNHRPFTPPLEGTASTYGYNTNSLETWVSYWANSYNFTAREEHLNQYPHYKTNIQGLDIHFMWIKPEVEEGLEVLPLLMMHGWTGSIVEFYKAIPVLSEKAKEKGFAIEFVIPSLPGFGFSETTHLQGFGATEMAVVMRNLMHRLGHKKFYLQGGDWGARIGNNLASYFPDELYGYHTNFGISNSLSTLATWLAGSLSEGIQKLVEDPAALGRLYPIGTVVKKTLLSSGYFHLQATKPYTVGVAMSDSPVGLLAYIFQLMSMITRHEYESTRDDDGLVFHYSRDELLDNLMVYWVNNAFITSGKIYSESLNSRNLNNGYLEITTPVPTWFIQAKDEFLYMSPEMLKFAFSNIVNTTAIETGGHYLAFELPELFSDSVITAITEFRRLAKEKCRTEL